MTKIIDPQFLELVSEGRDGRTGAGPGAQAAYTANHMKMPARITGLGEPKLMTFKGKGAYAVVAIDHFFDPDFFAEGPPTQNWEGQGIREEAAKAAAISTLRQLKALGLAEFVGMCDGMNGSYQVFVGTPFAEEETSKNVAARLCACAALDEPDAFEEALREHVLAALDQFATPFGERGWIDGELPALFRSLKSHSEQMAMRIRSRQTMLDMTAREAA